MGGEQAPHDKTITNRVRGLLGVQLDDEVHSDIEVDIGLGRHSNDLALEGVLVTVQPLGGSNKSVVFLQLLEESIGSALFGNSDHVTGLHQVAGDVDPAAVDGEVAMVDGPDGG